MDILLLNAIMYLVWFIIVWNKEKQLTVYSFFILFYTIMAFLSYYLISFTSIYSESYGYVNSETLSVEPYIYAFVVNIILFSPFKGLKYKHRDINSLFSKPMKIVINLWVAYSILLVIFKLSQVIISLSVGLDEMYAMRHDGSTSVHDSNNAFINYLNFFAYIIPSCMTPLVMLYSIIGVYYKKVSSSQALFLTVLAFLPDILNNIARGSRGGIFMTFFCLLFFIIIFYNFIPKKTLKLFYTTIISFLGLGAFYSWIITFSRFDGEGVLDVIIRYFGESFPNLGFNIWNKVTYHPMGDRMFPWFTGASIKADSLMDYGTIWSNTTGVYVYIFKTMFGDLYIEYGVIYAFLFVILLSFLFRMFIKNKSISIINLPIIYFYFELCVFSFSGFAKNNKLTVMQVLMIILYIIFVKYILRGKSSDNILIMPSKNR